MCILWINKVQEWLFPLAEKFLSYAQFSLSMYTIVNVLHHFWELDCKDWLLIWQK